MQLSPNIARLAFTSPDGVVESLHVEREIRVPAARLALDERVPEDVVDVDYHADGGRTERLGDIARFFEARDSPSIRRSASGAAARSRAAHPAARVVEDCGTIPGLARASWSGCRSPERKPQGRAPRAGASSMATGCRRRLRVRATL
jgi:hypothetical protein